MTLISREVFLDLLQLDDGWDLVGMEFSKPARSLTFSLAPKESWWRRAECPACRSIGCQSAGSARRHAWRHLDGFNAVTMIECDLPKAKCTACGRVSALPVPWQGRCRFFTKGFEAYALSVIRETTVRSASRVLGEKDQRLWRMLYAYLEGAQGELASLAVGILHREWKRPPR
jgi:transposase